MEGGGESEMQREKVTIEGGQLREVTLEVRWKLLVERANNQGVWAPPRG